MADGLTALETLIAREREHLLAGEIEALVSLTAEKERLLETLRGNECTDPARWQALDHAARRNQSLLAAALDGIRAAENRLAEARRAVSELDTYGDDGRRQTLGGQHKTLERKA